MENIHEYLFRLQALKATSEDCVPVQIIGQTDNELPIPCPGIMRQKDLDSALKGEHRNTGLFAHSIVPFCPRSGHNMRMKVAVTPGLRPMEPKNYLVGHRLEAVEKFPGKELLSIQEVVKDRGATSFLIEGHKQMKSVMRGLIKPFKKHYKLVQCMKYNTSNGRRDMPGDDMQLLITFAELQYCIPIYNSKKLDGMGVYVFLVYPKSMKKKDSFRYCDGFTAVLSQYPDNILTIDGGSKINDKSNIPDALINHMVSSIESDDAMRLDELKKKKAKAGPAPVVTPSGDGKKLRAKKKVLKPSLKSTYNERDSRMMWKVTEAESGWTSTKTAYSSGSSGLQSLSNDGGSSNE